MPLVPLLTYALQGVSSRLEQGFGADVVGRERRLRLALADALGERAEVAEVRISPEWRPEMPLWSPGSVQGAKLGGFDVAVQFEAESGYALVVELKWSKFGLIDALDEVMWDAFKLAHAVATLPGVRFGLLCYLAPSRAWDKPARFATLFDDGLIETRKLIADHEAIWDWCLAQGSASRPTKLPPLLETHRVARVPVVLDGKEWQIRAASVVPSGDPWLELDASGIPIADRV
jgi:hypothetical protein